MLNYRQLFYFWTVAKTGGIARAAERLHLTPQTISGQIRDLERTLGTDLFARAGRRIQLTAAGKRALSQAEEIFHLGQELEASLRNPTGDEGRVFRVGSLPARSMWKVVRVRPVGEEVSHWCVAPWRPWLPRSIGI